MLETRARAEEAKFALDRDAASRRTRAATGCWAAGPPICWGGLRGEAAEGYALELMRDDVETCEARASTPRSSARIASGGSSSGCGGRGEPARERGMRSASFMLAFAVIAALWAPYMESAVAP